MSVSSIRRAALAVFALLLADVPAAQTRVGDISYDNPQTFQWRPSPIVLARKADTRTAGTAIAVVGALVLVVGFSTIDAGPNADVEFDRTPFILAGAGLIVLGGRQTDRWGRRPECGLSFGMFRGKPAANYLLFRF